MPQVDFEAQVFGRDGGACDRNIASQTDPDHIPYSVVVDDQQDFPPESFWLSKDAEFDWFDRNAFLDRKDSTKRNSISTNLNRSRSTSNSQRVSMNLKSKPTIIGLPKTQKMSYVDSKHRRCKPPNIRLFPKRSDSGGKASATEPSSPKVSCIGRVRSRRCRSRRKSSRPEKPVSQPSSTGFISRITSLFQSEAQRRRKHNKFPVKVNESSENSTSRRNSVTVKPVDSEPAAPDLGGMTRFASGRRSELRAGAIDIDGVGRRELR